MLTDSEEEDNLSLAPLPEFSKSKSSKRDKLIVVRTKSVFTRVFGNDKELLDPERRGSSSTEATEATHASSKKSRGNRHEVSYHMAKKVPQTDTQLTPEVKKWLRFGIFCAVLSFLFFVVGTVIVTLQKYYRFTGFTDKFDFLGPMFLMLFISLLGIACFMFYQANRKRLKQQRKNRFSKSNKKMTFYSKRPQAVDISYADYPNAPYRVYRPNQRRLHKSPMSPNYMSAQDDLPEFNPKVPIVEPTASVIAIYKGEKNRRSSSSSVSSGEEPRQALGRTVSKNSYGINFFPEHMQLQQQASSMTASQMPVSRQQSIQPPIEGIIGIGGSSAATQQATPERLKLQRFESTVPPLLLTEEDA